MSDRGDYRSLYCSFWDDPDVHALAHLEYRVLTTLKGVLPPTGIGVVYDSQMCERCRCTPAELEAAYQALETPKPGGELGWVVRERNVVWLVNGLHFSPNLSHTDRKHRKFVRRLVAPLSGRAILRRYVDRYREWFADDGDSSAEPAASKALQRAKEGGSEHIPSRSESVPFRSVTSDSDAAEPGTPTARLAALRDRFFATFYGGATAERRAAVDRQLDEALSAEGWVVRRRPRLVVHANLATLANAIEATLREGVEKPDSAVVVVARKLEGGRCNLKLNAEDRTPTEAAAHAAQQQAARDHGDRSRLLDAAWAYAAAHEDAWRPRLRAIEAEHPEPSADDPRRAWRLTIRQGAVEGAVLAFYHQRAGELAATAATRDNA